MRAGRRKGKVVVEVLEVLEVQAPRPPLLLLVLLLLLGAKRCQIRGQPPPLAAGAAG